MNSKERAPVVVFAILSLATVGLATLPPVVPPSAANRQIVATESDPGLRLEAPESSTSPPPVVTSASSSVADVGSSGIAAVASGQLPFTLVVGRIIDETGAPFPAARVRLLQIDDHAGEASDARRERHARETEALAALPLEERRVFLPRLEEESYRELGAGVTSLDGTFAIAPVVSRLAVGAYFCVRVFEPRGTRIFATGGVGALSWCLRPAPPPGQPRRISVSKSSFGATYDVLVGEDGVVALREEDHVREQGIATMHVRAGGVALAGTLVECSVHSDRGGWMDRRWKGLTDRDGVFEVVVPVYEKATLTLEVSRSGFATVRHEEKEPVFPFVHDVDLVPESVIEGRVLEPSGEPRVAAKVFLDLDESTRFVATTDGHGHFAFHGLKAGDRVRVFPALRDDSRLVERMVVATAPERDLVVTLQEPAALTVKAAAPEGTHVTVHVQEYDEWRAEWLSSSKSDGDSTGGVFEHAFDRVSPGKVRVYAEAAGFEPTVSAAFEVGAEDDVAIDLRLTPGRPIVGRVVDEAGHPLGKGQVVVVVFGVDFPHDIEDDGSFTVTDAPQGQAELWFKSSGSVSCKVVVPAGESVLADVVLRPR